MTDKNIYEKTFFPHAHEKFEQMRNKDHPRFVYYTSAQTALYILKFEEIWMRNAMTMNDYAEIQYGIHCINVAKSGSLWKKFVLVLDSYFPEIEIDLTNAFNTWEPAIRASTYITCVSVHHDNEDDHGRLSMWRAYGAPQGVALVLNGAAMLQESDALGVYASPVSYLNQKQFEERFSQLIDNIDREREYIASMGREKFLEALFQVFRMAALCTKHPGFHEEEEWRVYMSPSIEKPTRLGMSVEVIQGTPQIVYKIPLKNIPEENFLHMDLNTLIDRIIIGPCESPLVTRLALSRLLIDKQQEKLAMRIYSSNIPLRQHP